MIRTRTQYLIFLVLVLAINFFISGASLVREVSLFAIGHCVLSSLILILLVLRSKYTVYVIQVWALIPILAGLLIVVGATALALGGAIDKIDLKQTSWGVANVLIGILAYKYRIFSVDGEQIEE